MGLPALDDSALALETLELSAGLTWKTDDPDRDTLIYVAGGAGLLSVDSESVPVRGRSAGLVVAGERGVLQATDDLDAIVLTVAANVDLHAPLGARELVRSLEDSDQQQATGARSFQLLFGPHNGSARATLFAGFVPPGRAPWHYHLYDEIVWIPDGPGQLHLEGSVEELGSGSAFRLRPREVHIVENTSPDRELTIIGLFTPAGSPSAAYLTPEVAAEYRFAG